MPAGGPPSSRKASDARRREIAEAALRVVAARGLGGFTALAIAREVGVTDAALFRHFRSKEEIVDAAIDRVEELLFDGAAPSSDDPVERLGAFFRRRVAVIREHAGISRLLVSEELARAASASGVERVAAFRRRSMDFVRDCLAAAKRRGLLAPGLGAEEAAVVVLGSVFALAHWPAAARREPFATPAPRIWEALETFLRGTSASPRLARRPPRRAGRASRGGA